MRAALVLAASALVVACVGPGDSVSAGPSTSPALSTRIPNANPCLDNPTEPRCSTPPPGWTPAPPPPCDHPLRTPDEVRAATAGWHLAPPGQASPSGSALPLGDPVLVRALRIGDPDEWLVPWLDERGGAIEVIAIGVRADGRGCPGMSTGWSGPFPRISIDAARRRTAGPNDPVRSIEAVTLPWTKVLPPSSDTNLVWRVTRASGHEIFLFDDGLLFEGSLVRSMLAPYMSGAGQRGDPAGATPRPSFTWPPRYPVRTTDEVLAGLRTDGYFLEHLRYLRAETGEPHPPVIDPRADVPVRVVGIHKPYTVDVWLVPIRDRAGDVVSIVDVRIDDDGLGSALTARGWSGPFPRVAEADARTLASAPDDPAIDATLGWAEEYIASPGGATAPVWLITRRGGAQFMVTEERGVVPVTR